MKLSKKLYVQATLGTGGLDLGDRQEKAADTDIYAENHQLRKQLKSFVAQVRQNEEKLHRFQDLELRLIECASLFDLIQVVIHQYRSTSHLDRVTLLLIDPEYEYRRVLEEEGVDVQGETDLVFVDNTDTLEQFFGFTPQAVLGSYHPQRHSQMFPGDPRPPSSTAILPLVRDGELIGSLNLGSHKAERFLQGSASDFLQRLASFVAICIKNSLNHERLKRVGLTDVLTGVNNRRFFDQRLTEEVSRATRQKQPLSCLFLDVDHFKRVNDVHGHQAGDMALREVADVLRKNMRTSDVLARYGGEEFSALLINTPMEKAHEIGERIRAEIAQKRCLLPGGNTLSVTISVGIATFRPGRDNQDALSVGAQLVQQADKCLYHAKNTGRNKVVSAPEPTANELDLFGNAPK